MGAYQKLKWKRALNEYRFIKEEYDILKSISREIAPLFQEHYERILQENGIDLSKLNNENKEKISDAYGESAPTGSVPIQTSDCTDMVPSEEIIEKSEKVQLTEDEIAIHNVFSKLFKSIALILHPDKIDPLKHNFTERRKMTESFKKANRAITERDYFILLEIAERLDIPLPKNYDQQTRWMKVQLKELTVKVHQERNTYNQVFAAAETKEEKDRVIKQFIKQLFGADLN
jgi:hypothetical protein